MALCTSLGKAARWRDPAHSTLDRGGARACLSSPITSHAACSATAYWYVKSVFSKSLSSFFHTKKLTCETF